jgi:acyl-CoA reductase-like NAD-dependent aldehyde dehydrogenase
MHKVAPAFASACPVIVKPAPQTPLATLWLVDLFRSAAADTGLSPNALQLLTGDAAIGSRLVEDPRVAAVTFTGSAKVGHLIARQAAPRKVLLELGSNAPLVVADDADLVAAARAIVRGGYYASGQACISVQRVIADERIHDELHERVVALVGSISTGDPRDPATTTSALIDERSTRRVLEWVDQAVDEGADITAGGELDGRCIRPTLLRDVPRGCMAWREEIFGPVVAFRSAVGFTAALEAANDSRYGLHASVFTASLDRAMYAYETLAYGGVVVNEVPGFRSDYMPYGGVKDSGIGREGPRFAMNEMTTERMAIIRVPQSLPDPHSR